MPLTNGVIGELIEHALNVAEERKLVEGKTPLLALSELVKVFNLTATDSTTFLLVLRTAELLSEDLVSFFADARRRGIIFDVVDGKIKMKPVETFNATGYQGGFAEYKQKQMVPRVKEITMVVRDVENGWLHTPKTEG